MSPTKSAHGEPTAASGAVLVVASDKKQRLILRRTWVDSQEGASAVDGRSIDPTVEAGPVDWAVPNESTVAACKS
jgi:hypothetical protein